MFSSTILGGLLPLASAIGFALCLAVAAIGFKRLVWFISIGYGLSVAALALLGLAAGGGSAGAVTWIASLFLLAYGLRLGIYLWKREGNKGYRAVQDGDAERSKEPGLAFKALIWLTVAFLYVAMTMPTYARLSAEAAGLADPLPGLSIAGLAVMAAGILVETVADRQKSRAKREAPGRFCDRGLYRFVRCPNYLGELLVWTGQLLAGASLLRGPLAWALAVGGYASICLIMKGSARRLELKQEERYGADPEYRAYATSVPILLPFIPVYSFKNAKIYFG